ncbi:FHA domain-containing protein, partial [bacterium]|nr:FHA domain-containing protein [bacterium]
MKDEFRIGREKDNDLVIANPKVSGHHAVLRK